MKKYKYEKFSDFDQGSVMFGILLGMLIGSVMMALQINGALNNLLTP